MMDAKTQQLRARFLKTMFKSKAWEYFKTELLEHREVLVNNLVDEANPAVISHLQGEIKGIDILVKKETHYKDIQVREKDLEEFEEE